jgi:hypothetical protein
MWLDKKTPDGRWRYGYGQYDKSVVQYVDLPMIPASLEAVFKSWLNTHLHSHVNVPVFYVWGVDPNGQKRIGGEWTLFHGGSAAMLSYFNNSFEPCFLSAASDQVRIACIDQSKMAPGTPSTARAVTATTTDIKAAAVKEAGLKAAAAAKKGAETQVAAILIPAVIAGLAILYFTRK